MLPTTPHQHRGFSLIEMLVAVSIFAIVMVVSMGTLIVLISANSVAQATQSISTNLSFAMDSMSRNIRTGYSYYCTNTVQSSLQNGTRDCVSGADMIIFTDDETEQRTAYRYDPSEEAVYQRIEAGSWLRITASDIRITDMMFVVVGSSPSDSLQPQVRIFLKGESANPAVDIRPFYLQSSVVSRVIDV